MRTGAVWALLLTVLLGGCAVSPEVSRRTTLQFNEAMFGGAFDSDVPRNGRLIRWETPIYVHFSGPSHEKYAPTIAASLRRAGALAGIPIHFQEKKTARTNFEVVLSDLEGFKVRRDFALCAAIVNETGGKIHSVTLIITHENVSGESSCVAHEIMHAMGFRYHSGNLPSALSPAHQESDFTFWDRLILQKLYAARLKVKPEGGIAPQSPPEMGQQWIALYPRQSTLKFSFENLEAAQQRYMFSKAEDRSGTFEIGIWTGGTLRFPKAQILSQKLASGFYFSDLPNVEALIRKFAYFKKTKLVFGPLGHTRNRIGDVGFRPFAARSSMCVGFVQEHGLSIATIETGVPSYRNRLGGYYCSEPGGVLTDETIERVVKSVGLKQPLKP